VELQLFGVQWMAKCLKENSQLKTNSLHTEITKNWNYCILFYFWREIIQEHTSLSRLNNEFCNPSSVNKLCNMSSVISIFQCDGILIYFFLVLDLSTWSLFFVSNTLGFLWFLQGLLAFAFEKIKQNKKKIHLSLA